MRWVKLTFPPRRRARWLLRMVRLSSSSLAGTRRTDVAVGTARLDSMLAANRAAAPLRGCVRSPSGAGAGGGTAAARAAPFPGAFPGATEGAAGGGAAEVGAPATVEAGAEGPSPATDDGVEGAAEA